MPVIFSAIVGGLSSLAGDALSSSTASQANATNEAMNQENINAAMQRQVQAQQWNAAQADVTRQAQEAYQTQSMQTAMDYNTQMSNTAMQRRVEDLKAAGINPLLAISQGGASTPGVSPMPGSSAMGTSGVAGSPGSIPMQNTGAAFGNLGGQMTSAIQVGQNAANIDLIRAQTNKTNEEAGQVIPAQVKQLAATTGLTTDQATIAQENAEKIANDIKLQKINLDYADINNLMQSRLLGAKADVAEGTIQALKNMIGAESSYQSTYYKNMTDLQKSNWGQFFNYMQHASQPVSSAASAIGAIF